MVLRYPCQTQGSQPSAIAAMMVLRWMLVFTQLLPRLVAPQRPKRSRCRAFKLKMTTMIRNATRTYAHHHLGLTIAPVECNAEIPCANGGFCDAAQCLLCPKDGECAIDTLSDYAIVSATPPVRHRRLLSQRWHPSLQQWWPAVATSVSASVTVSVATTVAATSSPAPLEALLEVLPPLFPLVESLDQAQA